MNIDEVMVSAPVIPVLVLDGSIDPAALAETLVGAGLPVIEVTLRTPAALEAIGAMSRVEGAIVGAGTVLNERMLGEAMAPARKTAKTLGLDVEDIISETAKIHEKYTVYESVLLTIWTHPTAVNKETLKMHRRDVEITNTANLIIIINDLVGCPSNLPIQPRPGQIAYILRRKG